MGDHVFRTTGSSRNGKVRTSLRLGGDDRKKVWTEGLSRSLPFSQEGRRNWRGRGVRGAEGKGIVAWLKKGKGLAKVARARATPESNAGKQPTKEEIKAIDSKKRGGGEPQ